MKRSKILLFVLLVALFMVAISCSDDNSTSTKKVVKNPVIEPNGGEFQAPQTVEISCETDDASIYYTTDDTEPTEESFYYVLPITLGSDTILKAKAFRDDWQASETVSAEFLFENQTGVITVNSTPAGASIYFDGTNMNMITPNVLTNVSSGSHHIRLYKEGYNEYNESFEFDHNFPITIDAILTEAGFPLPMITIEYPTDGEHFENNVINIYGTIYMIDEEENELPFNSNTAVLTLNGIDTYITTYSGYIDTDISITAGMNTLQVRATNEEGITGISDTITIYGDFTEPDIEITLTWNTPNSDLDLHIWNPSGEHCYYGNYGPETFTAQTALDGTYVVQVNMYALHGDPYSDATIQLHRAGMESAIYGPKRISVEDYEGEDPDAWWEVVEFTVISGKIASMVTPISEEMRAKISADMKALKQK